MQYLSSMALALALIATSVMQAMAGDEHSNSGFLGDDAVYAKLEKVEVPGASSGKRWIGPKLNVDSYSKVLVSDVILYPAPEPTEQVSAETLTNISQYLTQELKKRVSARTPLADAAGPGVLQMDAALTGVAVETEGVKPYEILPVAAVFGAAQAVTGNRDREVRVFIEVKLLDSQSGELVGVVIREAAGENLDGKKDKLTLKDMQDSLDGMANDGAAHLADSMQ